ncbi:MAG TPA: OmpA family protein [Kofleriaceae bacterium]|jgi:OOP family OmpA-OmpF porin|nr:OmpA family protein [Kofleriaceae bacterium]
MRTWLVISTVALCGCGGPVVFQGQSTLPVTGNPPPVVAAKPPPRVEIRDNKIEIHDKIQFDYDKATIKPESFGLMNEIASVIVKNPQIKKIRIEGNASAEGNAQHNQKLSEDRAHSVLKYLTEHGIATGELSSIGYGTDHPIADNATEAGREQNRRVEFVILEEDVTHKKVEVDAQTGAEKVVDEKHEVVRAADADASKQNASKSGTKGQAPAGKKKGG